MAKDRSRPSRSVGWLLLVGLSPASACGDGACECSRTTRPGYGIEWSGGGRATVTLAMEDTVLTGVVAGLDAARMESLWALDELDDDPRYNLVETAWSELGLEGAARSWYTTGGQPSEGMVIVMEIPELTAAGGPRAHLRLYPLDADNLLFVELRDALVPGLGERGRVLAWSWGGGWIEPWDPETLTGTAAFTMDWGDALLGDLTLDIDLDEDEVAFAELSLDPPCYAQDYPARCSR